MKATLLHLFSIGLLSCFLLASGLAKAQTAEPDTGSTTTASEPAGSSDTTTTVSSEPPPPPSSGSAVTGTIFLASYRSGSFPFKEKTKVTIQQTGDSYTFAPASGEPVNIPLKDIRGAIETENGMWFYWYDSSGNTLNGFFKMDMSKTPLVGEINTRVTGYHNRPRDQEEEYKRKYQSYEDQAIKEAK